MKYHRISIFLVLLFLTVGLPLSAVCQTASKNSENLNAPDSSETKTPPPALSEAIAFCAEVVEQAAVLKTNVEALPDFSEAETSLINLQGETEKLSENVLDLIGDPDTTYDQISQVKSLVTGKEEIVEDLTSPIEQTTKLLESWKRQWQEKQVRLKTFKGVISKAPSESAAQASLKEAQRTLSASLQLISKALDRVLTVQQKGATVRARIQAMKTNVDSMLSAVRGQSLKRSVPFLLSPLYRAEFKKGLWDDFLQGTASIELPKPRFWRLKGWVVFLHALLAILISASIVRNRQFIAKIDRWRFLMKRPLTTGLFVSGWIVGPFYGIVDQTVAFVLWAIASITAARLIGGLTQNYSKRVGLYTLAGLVLFLQFCRLIALPVPLLRLCILLIALAAMVFCALMNIRNARQGASRLYLWALRLGSLVFLAVAVLEIIGYHLLAEHLLASSLKTLLILLLGWMFVVLLGGWVKFVSRKAFLDGIPRFRASADIIGERLTSILGFMVYAFVAVILLVIWRVYENVPDAFHGLFSVGFSLGSWKLTLGMVIIVAVALYLSFVLSWVVQGILMERVFPKRGVQRGVQSSMARLIHYGIIFAGFLLALSFLGVDMKNITIIGGALGVGIGFGLQSIVSNFVSGLILLFERPIKAGDYVQLGDRWGEISRIGLRSTVVKTFDRSEVVVPNSQLISNEVTNWTLTDRTMRLKLPVGVAYGSDIEKVITTLKECAQENPMVVSSPAPQVFFMNFGDSCLDFELRVWISDIDNMVVARSEINQEIDRTFRAAGIEIAFPQRDLHLRSVDETAVLPLKRFSRGTDPDLNADGQTAGDRKEQDDS